MNDQYILESLDCLADLNLFGRAHPSPACASAWCSTVLTSRKREVDVPDHPGGLTGGFGKLSFLCRHHTGGVEAAEEEREETGKAARTSEREAKRAEEVALVAKRKREQSRGCEEARRRGQGREGGRDGLHW